MQHFPHQNTLNDTASDSYPPHSRRYMSNCTQGEYIDDNAIIMEDDDGQSNTLDSRYRRKLSTSKLRSTALSRFASIYSVKSLESRTSSAGSESLEEHEVKHYEAERTDNIPPPPTSPIFPTPELDLNLNGCVNEAVDKPSVNSALHKLQLLLGEVEIFGDEVSRLPPSAETLQRMQQSKPPQPASRVSRAWRRESVSIQQLRPPSPAQPGNQSTSPMVQPLSPIALAIKPRNIDPLVLLVEEPLIAMTPLFKTLFRAGSVKH
ncbi:hypothetical protein BC829DRAFT_265392 [Chytridium lagenaria]|nr:hypothetical protein BC829DRAFT_265392 [Chytridium lagenaria]